MPLTCLAPVVPSPLTATGPPTPQTQQDTLGDRGGSGSGGGGHSPAGGTSPYRRRSSLQQQQQQQQQQQHSSSYMFFQALTGTTEGTPGAAAAAAAATAAAADKESEVLIPDTRGGKDHALRREQPEAGGGKGGPIRSRTGSSPSCATTALRATRPRSRPGNSISSDSRTSGPSGRMPRRGSTCSTR